MPRLDLGAGASGMMEWVRRSLASNTWSSYNKVWCDWARLEQEMGMLDNSDDRLGLLAWQLSKDFDSNVSVSVIERKLSALAFLFKFWGWTDVTKDFAIKQALKGFKKGRRSTDIGRPITLNILEGIFSQLGCITESPFELLLFRLAFSWAFFGAFRISELVSSNRAGAGGLSREDIKREEQSLSIRIREAKTDKSGKGFMVELHGVGGFDACPVKCFDEYCRVRREQVGIFLIHQDGSALSKFQFVAVLRRTLGGLKLAAAEYGSHSFRIGAATEAARWGLDEAVIRRIGRWESNRYRALQGVASGTFIHTVHWAAQRATFHRADGQLGFQQTHVQLRWVSRRGLKWEEIVPLVVQKAKEFGPPNIIVLHAGGNDVGQSPMKFLIKDIRRHCLRLWSLFPGVVLIWSEIIPSAHWRGAHSHQAVNRARIKINRAVSKFVQGNGGIIVRHMDLEKDLGYFLPEGVHLNDLGLDLFNFSFQEAITLA
ncbi:hypothetical protein XELAEV_18005938mg [Xenopus laevis]|uniref:Uncharacterized protein n=1 Tax=Xenopus laevis TaxID=8355 RepID=A0A974DZK9_XENLA|nr:hypothetical protein XELAEV_18005938mg [Xenopus laevis]